jgi:hypothetical protein
MPSKDAVILASGFTIVETSKLSYDGTSNVTYDGTSNVIREMGFDSLSRDDMRALNEKLERIGFVEDL